MNNNIDISSISIEKLAKMKIETPVAYENYKKVLSEVMSDLTDIGIKELKRMQNKMEGD
jgi:hypothetical protein